MRENINHLKNTFDRTKNIYSKDFIMQYDKLSFNEKNTAAKLFFNKIENFSEFSKSYLKSKSFAKEATTPGFKIDDDICHKFISMSIKEKDIACKLSTNVSQLNEYIFRNTLKMKMLSENTIRKYYLKETNLRKEASYQYLVYFLKKHLK